MILTNDKLTFIHDRNGCNQPCETISGILYNPTIIPTHYYVSYFILILQTVLLI